MSLPGPSRRIAKTGIALAVALVLVVVATVAITVRRPLPDYNGTTKVPGLNAATAIIRDARGIPQIYADNPSDLFYAQGFVAAQDRFFQMDVRRHLTAGRLSELVGQSDQALAADRLMRTLGARRVAERELALVSPATRRYLQAYADGVNAYVAHKAPSDLGVGYTVLGVKVDLGTIEPWSPVDSLAWLKAMAWDLKGNYNEELGRAAAYGSLRGRMDLVKQLYPAYPYRKNPPILPAVARTAASAVGNAQRLDPERSSRAAQAALAAAAKAIGAVPEILGKQGVGSNSWVVSGRFTESGKPLLANDPHLGAQLPSIWHQVGLHCRRVSAACPFDVAGFSLPGLPAVVIGHNAKIAWGFTNLGADVSDFFLEKVTQTTAVRSGRQVPLTIRTETIKVAGGAPVRLKVRSTMHGPLISDAVPGVRGVKDRDARRLRTPAAGLAVALQWTALKPGRAADGLFGFDTATNVAQFRAAAAKFDVPAQNLVYADTAGHIAYQTPGRIPVRGKGPGLGMADGNWPRPGWNPAWDWKGWVPFSKLPRRVDPAEGFIVAANQAVTPAGVGPYLTTDFDGGYRSTRIRALLKQQIRGGKVSVAAMNRLQNDSVDPFSATLTPYLLATPLATRSLGGTGQRVSKAYLMEAVDLLRGWDGRDSADSGAAAFYNAVWSNLLRLTFADQVSPELVMPGDDRAVTVMTRLLKEPNNPFWDNVRTRKHVETRDQILAEAILGARAELTSLLGRNVKGWSWGKLHRLRLESSIVGGDGVPGPVRSLVNPVPVEVGGSSAVVNATGWSAKDAGNYDATSVPSMRMVVDLGNLDNSTWLDLTGVSGHPRSPHYTDQLQAWADGRTFGWPFSRGAIDRGAKDTLTLLPDNSGD